MNNNIHSDLYNHPVLQKAPAKTKDKMAINLIKIFRDGPEVSLRGSPTVSPINLNKM